jgi:thiamine biosynthesis lipoprotein
VEHPLDTARTLMTVALGAGGVATSSTLSRAWVMDGDRRHHVIDPSTGESGVTDLAAVTVFARAGWEAEVHATAALLSGADRALAYLERQGLDGIATSLDGTTTVTPALLCAGETEWSAA